MGIDFLENRKQALENISFFKVGGGQGTIFLNGTFVYYNEKGVMNHCRMVVPENI